MLKPPLLLLVAAGVVLTGELPLLRAPLRWRCFLTIIWLEPHSIGSESMAESSSALGPVWVRLGLAGCMEMRGTVASFSAMSTSLTLSILSCDPAASAAEGGVGTSSSSMGEGTSRRSELAENSCWWRRRTCCLNPVRTRSGLAPGRIGTIGVGTRFTCSLWPKTAEVAARARGKGSSSGD